MGEKNRHFSREFKIDAVQMVTEKKMSVSKVAKVFQGRHKTIGVDVRKGLSAMASNLLTRTGPRAWPGAKFAG